jgi:hypothetical protein
MIHFKCPNCAKGFTVDESSCGKKGECPKCKSIIVIPQTNETSSTSEEGISSTISVSSVELQNKNKFLDLKELQKPEFPDEQPGSAICQQTGFPADGEQQKREMEQNGFERKLPWFIDVFLYPANITGMVMLIILAGIPLLIMVLSLLPLMGCFGGIVNIVIVLYAYWYLCQCVRDSAEGYVRIPRGIGNYPDLRDMFSEMANMVGCLILFFAPAYIYTFITKQENSIFYSLLVLGIIFYPMSLLSIIMHDSAYGLNPLLLGTSIAKTFFRYMGLVLVFLTGVFIIEYLPSHFINEYLSFYAESAIASSNVKNFYSFFYSFYVRSIVITGLFRFVEVYFLMVAAHLLGRFYYKNSQKLNWEV